MSATMRTGYTSDTSHAISKPGFRNYLLDFGRLDEKQLLATSLYLGVLPNQIISAPIFGGIRPTTRQRRRRDELPLPRVSAIRDTVQQRYFRYGTEEATVRTPLGYCDAYDSPLQPSLAQLISFH